MASKHIFTKMEKKVFLDVLKSHAAIIENKNTDGSTLREKNVAWEKIAKEYNASPHVTVEVSFKQLRRLWINLKQRQREAKTKERQHRMATGGGPSTSRAAIDPDVAASISSSNLFQESTEITLDLDSPSSVSTPPHQVRTIPLPPPSTSSTFTTSFQCNKSNIQEKEHMDRLNREREIHAMEKELLKYKIREAKAKAELAELILEKERSREGTNE